ncbi:hypothetical protein KSP40_PGU014324 [Platanthera guangdongensis]|uniref:Uncharacterized protein n=1 Tax=Platanthera guangdongensis TaxID=2320717 RepID=A0ABR2LN61_9ASPA
MDSSPLLSPSSDEHLWNSLHDRVDAILDDRKSNNFMDWPFSDCNAESKHGKLFREDSMLLIRGLDSVSSSLSQLTETLGAAKKGLNDLAKPSLQRVQKRGSQGIGDEDEPRKAKKQCSLNTVEEDSDGLNVHRNSDSKEESASGNPTQHIEDNHSSVDAVKMSMVSKATSLARELKTIRTELNFMQERCALLEEENRRLRDGSKKGEMAEEDDLVRIQLETLLAEKSKLANENANLRRDNQCLHQLVEYHQLTSQDLLSSYEDVVDPVLLDFSSPARNEEDFESKDNEHSKEQDSNKL